MRHSASVNEVRIGTYTNKIHSNITAISLGTYSYRQTDSKSSAWVRVWLLIWFRYSSGESLGISSIGNSLKKLGMSRATIHLNKALTFRTSDVKSLVKKSINPEKLFCMCLSHIWKETKWTVKPWWRHQMGPFSALLALCAGNHRCRWIPLTMASDAELWCFLWSASE